MSKSPLNIWFSSQADLWSVVNDKLLSKSLCKPEIILDWSLLFLHFTGIEGTLVLLGSPVSLMFSVLHKPNISHLKHIRFLDTRMIILAQVCKRCSTKLQHLQSHVPYVWTQPSVPRTHSIQCPELGNRHPTRKANHYQITPVLSWANRNDPRICLQNCYSSLQQVQAVIWHISERLNFQGMWLCLHVFQLTADHEEQKFSIPQLRSFCFYTVQRAWLNNQKLVRKVRTYKTKVLNGTRLRPFTRREPQLEIGILS